VRPGTDAALALCLARLCFERGYADRAFSSERCVGAQEFEQHVRAAHDLAWCARTTGLAAADIEMLAELLGRRREWLLKTGVGFGRRRNGAMSMRALCSLVAVLGKPERIHYESFACFALANHVIERPDLRPAGARADVIQQTKTGRELMSGRFSAVFVWGHNPAAVCPEADLVRAGLARSDVFTVVHEHFLTDSAQLADVVLPATMFPEHSDLYRSYGHRRLRLARRALQPARETRSNVDAFAAIARALELPRETWDVTSDGLVDELVNASTSDWSDADRAALRRGEAVKQSPRGRAGDGTPSGKVELVSAAAQRLGQPAMASYVADDAAGTTGEFWLVCAPSVHTHNSTFSYSARHRRRRGSARVVMHPSDAQRLGLADRAPVTLSNRHGRVTLALELSSNVATGIVRVDGIPIASDTPEGTSINALVSGEVSDMGDSNTLYSTRVDVHSAAR
jgi:anaerobic selenocysteine-containing dehydrogenase